MKSTLSLILVTWLFLPYLGAQGTEPHRKRHDPAKVAAFLDGTAWQRMSQTAMNARRTKIASADIFEVPASLTVLTVRQLTSESGAMPITPEQARMLCGGHYDCAAGKKPFLIRAVYVARGSAEPLAVYRIGQSEVETEHMVLGYNENTVLKTALVVNVDFEITYTSCVAGFAM